LRVLYVTTKPPWPVHDGGRLLVAKTLAGLARRGHRVTLVCPADPSGDADTVRRMLRHSCRPVLVEGGARSRSGALARALLSGHPLSVERHRNEPVRRQVELLLGRETFDLVHAEQLQALPQVEAAFARGVPVVLRAQNVESDLWAAAAAVPSAASAWLAWEGRRLARWEGTALRQVSTTIALTDRDAARLRELTAGAASIVVARAPFDAHAPTADHPLVGTPALTLLGSRGWMPNRDAVRWFVSGAWPMIHRTWPAARLHCFGYRLPGRSPAGIDWHGAPADSRSAYAPGSILVVPLRIASGVRMKILEAWARGIPVIALPQAAAGLDAEDGRHLLIARDAAEFRTAVERLHGDPALAETLVRGGRDLLHERHDPDTVAAELEAIYRRVVHPAASAVEPPPRSALVAR